MSLLREWLRRKGLQGLRFKAWLICIKKVPKIPKKIGCVAFEHFFLLGGCEFEQTNLGVGGGGGGRRVSTIQTDRCIKPKPIHNYQLTNWSKPFSS